MKGSNKRKTHGPRHDRGMPRLTLRIDLSESARIGHGKIALLEAIGREGSISAAARALGMSYRRAWLLVDSLNRTFREPAVEARGGAHGGARVTAFGDKLIACYRNLEQSALRASGPSLRALATSLRPASARARRTAGRTSRH